MIRQGKRAPKKHFLHQIEALCCKRFHLFTNDVSTNKHPIHLFFRYFLTRLSPIGIVIAQLVVNKFNLTNFHVERMFTANVIVQNNKESTMELCHALNNAGIHVLSLISLEEGATKKISVSKPQAVLISCRQENVSLTELVKFASNNFQRPLILHCEQINRQAIETSTLGGINAFLMGILSKQNIEAVFASAIARYRHLETLQNELHQAKTRLKEHHKIDKAKALLIGKRNMSEQEAHRYLQKTAMEQNQRMGEVAQGVLAMADLIGHC